MIELRRTTSRDPAFVELVRALDDEMWARYGDLMNEFAKYNIVDTETALVAYAGDAPVGTGCFQVHDASTIELKRMYVAPAHRRTGVSAAVLRELEAWAAELGYAAIVLETGPLNVEAVGLYTTRGYARTASYGPYVDLPENICMRKSLR